MYLVVEWITRSAPSAIGCCRAGDRKVLSTADLQPTARARAQMSATSTTRISGLDGVSIRISLGFRARAASSAARSF